MTNDSFKAQEEAIRIARIKLLRYPAPDLEQIRICCEKAVTSVEDDFGPGSVDLASLIAHFERTSNIYVAPGRSLDDFRGHVEWLPRRRGEISWRFWERYETLLADVRGLPDQVVRSADYQSERILERLEDPARADAWEEAARELLADWFEALREARAPGTRVHMENQLSRLFTADLYRAG